jgi:hypothetical protein
MEKIDIQIAEIIGDYMLKGNGRDTANRLKELFGYEEQLPLDERRKAFADSLRPYLDRYGSEMIKAFYVYWADGKKKMAWEKEKSFHLEMRLSTWAKNNQKFSIANMIKTKGLTA